LAQSEKIEMKVEKKSSVAGDQWAYPDHAVIEKDFCTGMERVEKSISTSVQESMRQFEEWVTSREIYASLLD
jgi:hypothetical protein